MRYYKPKGVAVFMQYPLWLAEIPVSVLSLGAKCVYARLAFFSDDEGVAYPRLSTIAKTCGMCERSVSNYIKELEDFGLLERRRRGLSKSNEYRFPFLGIIENAILAAPDTHIDASHDAHIDATPIVKEALKRSSQKGICPLPTVEDVAAYMKERGWVDVDFNAKKFHDYYSAGDWKMKDGSRVKNWKRCVITWENTDRKRVQPTQEKPNLDIPSYDPSKAGLFA